MADDESTRTRRRRNWKRGMFRLWAVCAVGWMVVMGWMVTVDWWADAHDPLANAVRVEDLPPGFTLDPPSPQASSGRADILEAYLGLPETERAKVDVSPRGRYFRAFAGLPPSERRKVLTRLRRKAERGKLYGWLVQSGARLLVPPLLVLAGGVGLWWAASWVDAGFRKDT